jgi:tryptophan synthase alpha chain
MSSLQQLFERKKENVLNIYFTAGYPKLDDTETIFLNLEKAGVDIIEIGMPYSDPLADGPTIQESGQVALKNGMTLSILFDQLKSIRKKSDLPMILMGYFNQVMQYGEGAFLKKCSEIGVDALILPDLPLDVYESDYQELFKKYNLDIIFLITPQTSEKRIQKIDKLSTGFIYMVSSSSITGAKTGISEAQINYFKKIKKLTLKNPKLIGFGISDHETFATACQFANGAIIGSAFIKALSKSENISQTCSDFVQQILRLTPFVESPNS